MMETKFAARARPQPPPNSLWIDEDGHTFTNMHDAANTGIRRAMTPEAAKWCFEHVGPWIIADDGEHITFKGEADMLAFKMWWAGRS